MTLAKPEVAIPMTREQFYDWLMSRIRDGRSIALRELSDFARDERVPIEGSSNGCDALLEREGM
jgi:hypothetical protein